MRSWRKTYAMSSSSSTKGTKVCADACETKDNEEQAPCDTTETTNTTETNECETTTECETTQTNEGDKTETTECETTPTNPCETTATCETTQTNECDTSVTCSTETKECENTTATTACTTETNECESTTDCDRTETKTAAETDEKAAVPERCSATIQCSREFFDNVVDRQNKILTGIIANFESIQIQDESCEAGKTALKFFNHQKESLELLQNNYKIFFAAFTLAPIECDGSED